MSNPLHRQKNLTIMQILMLVVLGPVTMALILSAWLAIPRISDAAHFRDVERQLGFVGELSDLVLAQQKERGTTDVFLGSGGTAFADFMAEQRAATDEAAGIALAHIEAEIAASRDGAMRELLGGLRVELTRMGEIRAAVDALDIPAADALAYYTGLDGRVLAVVRSIGLQSRDPQILSMIDVFVALVHGMSYAGLERAAGAGGFVEGQFSRERMARFANAVAVQDTFQNVFAQYTTETQSQLYAEFLESPEVKAVGKLREAVIQSVDGAALPSVTGQDYFAAMTAKIDGLKAIEDRIIADILALADVRSAEARAASIRALLLAVLGTVISVAASLWIASRIRAAIARLADTAIRMSEGELDAQLPEPDRTEIGRLSGALDRFRRSILHAQQKANERRAREAADAERRASEAEATQTAERKAAEDAARMAEEQRKREAAAAAEIAEVVAACAEGDFSRRLNPDDKEGVFAELCQGVNRIGEITDAALKDIRTALNALSQGDLSYRSSADAQGIFGELSVLLNSSMDSLNAIVHGIRSNVERNNKSLTAVDSASENLARRTESNAATLEETSAALNELAGSVNGVANSMETMSRGTAAVSNNADEGRQVIENAMEAMKAIEESAQSIAGIIDLIDNIAFQTNLLALNAGVEAARAGEAGRGFSVVATEVRELSGRTSAAAKQIAELICISTGKVDDGVKLVERSGGYLRDIAAAVQKISEQVAQVNITTREQTSGIQEITASMHELDRATQENAGMFEETSVAVQAMVSEGAAMAEAVNAFTLHRQDPGEQAA